MKARSRIPSPGAARTSTDKPSSQWQGLPGSPAGGTNARPRPESTNTSGSILDWAASANKAPFPKQSGSVYNDAASTQDDFSANIDADRPSPAGSVARGMANMGLGPERPFTPPSEPKSSKMRSNILVAVRMRPLSEKERGRGDHEMWMLDEQNNIGCYGKDGSFVPKHRYDTVFGKQATNLDVHAVVARPLVAPSLQGISGTVFAYGVTSSGKTHTMMGGYSEEHGAEPGIVPNVVRELFAEIERVQAQQQQANGSPYYKQFSVRLSMMEIYNEVINDLLQPGQVNLKLLEVGGRGLVVDGLSEEPVGSAEDALELIAQGDAYRKVSSTAYNEDSSRSHTICRLHVDSMEVPAAGASPPQALLPRLPQQGGGRRTAAVLSLIDLAGSESAKVNQSKGQRMEGSFINKSLLTLGTVIHKLADARGQSQSHVPYRDSKLTRLLQSSMSGSGARIAIVCNITPAAAQFEETGNTLKFATRAKLVQVAVSANDVMDDRTLVRRYRQEAAELRKQLTALLALQNSGQPLPSHSHHHGDRGGRGVDGDSANGGRRESEKEGSMYGGSEVAILEMESELMDLKYQLEQERALRVKAEQDKKLMETRLRRLTCLLLEKQRVGGAIFRNSNSPTPPGDTSTQPQQQEQLEAIAREGREVYASLGAKGTSGQQQQQQNQQQQQQQQQPEPSGLGAERPPTPPQHPSTHSGPNGGVSSVASSITSPAGVRNGRFIRPNMKGPFRNVSQSLETGSQQDKPDEPDMDDEAEAELLAQIQELHGELAASKRQSGNSLFNSASGTPTTPQTQQPWEGSGQTTGTHTPNRGGYGRGGYSLDGTGADYEKDLEIQVLLADHEVLQDQIVTVEMSNQRLVNSNEQLAAEVAWYRLENEKERRIVRELESDMVELRSFKNEMCAQLEALKAELAEERGRRAAGHFSQLPRPNSSASIPTPLQPPGPPSLHGSGHFASMPHGPMAASSSFSSASGSGLIDASGFGELRAHMASGNAAMPELQARLEALEKHVLAAVASVIARNKQLETSLAQVSQSNQQLQGLHLEGMSPAQRTQLAVSQVQAAARLTQGLSKAEQASISSAMQGLTLPPPSQLTPPHHHQLPYTPQRAVPSVPQAPLTPQAPAIPQQQQQPQQELQGGTFTPANRVSMHQAGEQPAESNVLVEWDLLGPDEGEVGDEEDGAGGEYGEEPQQPEGLS
mmetsp:Transcript_8232/g.20399  ORF Transcript_8232/g.20399 Transcript_8232/m.20399 type:complete len:1198 (+) Transcript_8232:124-3717(+)